MKFTAEEDAKMNNAGEAESPLYKTDEFRMYCFKVLPCSKRYCHDWTTCPFAHPGEKAKRRDPRFSQYTGIACPEMKKNLACPRGETCPYAHNVFEYWLHPSRYRTQLCNDGVSCKRKVCFFAHTLEELRVPACKPVLPDDTLDTRSSDTDFAFAPQSSFQNLPDETAPAQQKVPVGSPVSIIGAGNEVWEMGTSTSSTPSSTWSPYTASLSYSNRSSSDSNATVGSNRPVSPSHDQLAQTLASFNLGGQPADQPNQLASILNLLMSQQQQQQQQHALASPSSVLTPAAAAAAASALFSSTQAANARAGLRAGPFRQAPSIAPFLHSSIPSPSSAILGNRQPTASDAPVDPSFPYQSALYAPAALAAQLQANQRAQAQAVQAAQVAQAAQAYAAEVDNMHRRSLDSATEALYNRILNHQLQAANYGRRSFDVRTGQQLNPLQMVQPLQPTWSTQSDTVQDTQQFAFDQAAQAQQQIDSAVSDKAEQLLRTAFTSTSQELSSDDEMVANMDMYRMLSGMQQQQQQQQQQQPQ